jgi:curved DNA-binding protein CbpA
MAQAMPQPDYYLVLGVSRGATADEIRHAHRLLVRRYHPDTAGRADLTRFAEVQEAYEVLSDPVRRRDYDRSHPAKVAAKRSPAYQPSASSSRPQRTTGAKSRSGRISPDGLQICCSVCIRFFPIGAVGYWTGGPICPVCRAKQAGVPPPPPGSSRGSRAEQDRNRQIGAGCAVQVFVLAVSMFLSLIQLAFRPSATHSAVPPEPPKVIAPHTPPTH